MAKLIVLGSSNAVPDEKHENTHMAVIGRERTLLIDCVSNPIVRLKLAGIEYDLVTDIILTHFHPDHVSGLPLLLMDLWLMGRNKPIHIYGLSYTLDRVEKLMEFYDWESWPRFFEVKFHRLPEDEMTLVLVNNDMRVFSSPVHHLIPNIGLRIEFIGSGKSMAYSCDTQPCQEVVRLAEDVDVLFHETSGASLGHTSASQAGEIATKARANSLFLIHYPTGEFDSESLLPEARTTFNGLVDLARDFMTFDF